MNRRELLKSSCNSGYWGYADRVPLALTAVADTGGGNNKFSRWRVYNSNEKAYAWKWQGSFNSTCPLPWLYGNAKRAWSCS